MIEARLVDGRMRRRLIKLHAPTSTSTSVKHKHLQAPAGFLFFVGAIEKLVLLEQRQLASVEEWMNEVCIPDPGPRA